MASFAPAFPGLIDQKLSKIELINVIMQDIVSEYEAIYLYQTHAEATDNPLAKKVFLDIANEEVVHVGEFMTLLTHIDPEFTKYLLQGESEVKQMMNRLNIPYHGEKASIQKKSAPRLF